MNTQLRFICTCTKLQASKMQLGRIVNKVMSFDKTKKQKSQHKQSSFDPSPALPFNSSGTKKVTTHKNRRVTVLNRVFMKYITDLMATGEVAPKLLGRGIEISHVKVSPDFSRINVYWYAEKESNIDATTEVVLRQSAGHLQHELSQLRVIGVVPPINFIKNKHYAVTREIENRLAHVDFGEDYIPTAYITQSSVPVLKTSLPQDVKAKISELDKQNNEGEEEKEDEEETYEVRIPEMRQDVMGFNHASVMRRIQVCISKAKLAERNRILNITPAEPVGSEDSSTDAIDDFLSSKEQKQLFDDFLKKRMISEKRKQRTIPLFEAKLQDELELREKMENEFIDDVDDLRIDEPYQDEYKDIESQH